jgi:hydroxymethylglutaryl-CoA lyase
MQAVSDNVRIVEVSPRDGLQFEKNTLSVEQKVTLINKLTDAGLRNIEAGSFVSSDKIPQLTDSDKVFNKLNLTGPTTYSALVPNEQGMQRALKENVKSIAIFTAASENFCEKNIGCSIEESFKRFKPVLELAKENNISVRGYLSCVFGCPYEGEIKMHQTIEVVKKLYEAGCDEISLGDTIGVGTPNQAQTLILHAGGVVPIDKLAVHYHDTRGQALANILASLEMGVSTIDSSVAGLGGCPYAQGASGNVATEDVVYMLHGLGINSGVDLHTIIEVGRWVSQQLNRTNGSRVGLSGAPHWIEES